MQFTFTLTPRGQHAPYLIRASLFTFLLICLIVLGVCFLFLGLLLQLGAIVAPWLIGNGIAVIKGTVTLFITFRLLLLAFRVTRKLHRDGKRHVWYNTLLALLRGTSLYLMKRFLYMLLG